MKITILSIGKFSNNNPNKQLFYSYQKRLNWKIDLKELEPKNNQTEGKLILSKIPNSNIIIALDEKGKATSSTEFSTIIKNYANQGNSNLTFIIGGADGLDPEIKKKSHLTLSLSNLTFPHMMVRTILIEQIYRAQTIINNHPYHRI